MKKNSAILLVGLMVAMLIAIQSFLGPRVLIFAVGFSSIWFVIAFILFSRPPGIPEFVSEEPGGDEQYVVRRDMEFKLSLSERLQLALGVACGSCLLIWLTLSLLAS